MLTLKAYKELRRFVSETRLMRLFLPSIAALLLAFSGSAAAGVVYDNGPSDGVAGGIMAGNVDGNPVPLGAIGENFTLASNKVITHVSFLTLEPVDGGALSASWDGTLSIGFLLSAGGLPGSGIGNLVAAGLGTLVSKKATNNYVTWGGYSRAPEYEYVVDLSTLAFGSTALTAGTPYWMSLYMGVGSNNIYWATTASKDGSAIRNTIVNAWFNIPQDFSFKLYDSDPTAVSAPSSLILLLAGLGVVGLRHRKRV